MMEWEPTEQESTRINAIRRSPANVNGYPSKRPEDQALKGKRAKWVKKSEIDKRRIEGRCLRCSRNNCRIDRCPLAAAIPPAYQTKNTSFISRAKITEAAIEDKATDLSDQ
jgi:hypothetical protein